MFSTYVIHKTISWVQPLSRSLDCKECQRDFLCRRNSVPCLRATCTEISKIFTRFHSISPNQPYRAPPPATQTKKIPPSSILLGYGCLTPRNNIFTAVLRIRVIKPNSLGPRCHEIHIVDKSSCSYIYSLWLFDCRDQGSLYFLKVLTSPLSL